MNISTLIPATLVARRAFYAHGRSFVYTNNYKDCHTVKAYRTGSSELDIKIASDIIQILRKSGYFGITTHFTEGVRSGGIIIRIPK
jgi:hypothetical protein